MYLAIVNREVGNIIVERTFFSKDIKTIKDMINDYGWFTSYQIFHLDNLYEVESNNFKFDS